MNGFAPLVTVEWLTEHLDHSALRLADCRWQLLDPGAGAIAYRSGHLPGAMYVSLEDHLSSVEGPGRHPLPARHDFAATLGSLGISNGSVVVGYDDRGGAIAARLWWMLRWMGHVRVAVLDGGYDAWVAAGLPLESGETHHPPTSYEPGEVSMPTVDRRGVHGLGPGQLLLDARDGLRYRGEEEPIDRIGGHIPGARNAPYLQNLDSALRFRSPAELEDGYRSLGVTSADAAVVYCGSGVTACHDILAMEVAGMGTAALYPGSWSDWSQTRDPVAVGRDPGGPLQSNPP